MSRSRSRARVNALRHSHLRVFLRSRRTRWRRRLSVRLEPQQRVNTRVAQSPSVARSRILTAAAMASPLVVQNLRLRCLNRRAQLDSVMTSVRWGSERCVLARSSRAYARATCRRALRSLLNAHKLQQQQRRQRRRRQQSARCLRGGAPRAISERPTRIRGARTRVCRREVEVQTRREWHNP